MIKFLKSIFSNLWTYVLIIFIFIPTILAVDLVQHYRNNQIVEVLEQVEKPEKTIEVVDSVPDQEFQNISLRVLGMKARVSFRQMILSMEESLVNFDSITILTMVHRLLNCLMSRNTSIIIFQVKDLSD